MKFIQRIFFVLILLNLVTSAQAATYQRPNGDTYFQTQSAGRLPLSSSKLDGEFNAIESFLNLQQGTWQAIFQDIRNYQEFVTAGDTSSQLGNWSLTGINTSNTNNGVLYWNLTRSAGLTIVSLYSDSGKTTLVSQGVISATSGSITLSAIGGSGLSGSVTAAYVVDDTDSGNTLTCGRLKNAVAAIGSAVVGLYVPNSVNVYTPVSVPSTLTLVFERGGMLNKSGSGSLAFASGSTIQAGRFKILNSFSQGDIAGLAEMWPEWPGVVGDGSSDDATAMQIAATASANGVLKFQTNKTYKIGTEITLPNNVVVDLNNAVIKPTGNTRTFVRQAPAATATTTISSGGTVGSRQVVVASATGIATGQWYFVTTSDGLFPYSIGKITGVSGTTITLDTPLPVTYLTPGGATLNMTTYSSLYGDVTIKDGTIDGTASTLTGSNDSTHSGVAIYLAGYENINIVNVKAINFAVDNSNNIPIKIDGSTVDVLIDKVKMSGCVIQNSHISVTGARKAEISRCDISGSGFGIETVNVASPHIHDNQVTGRRAQELAANPADTQHSIRGIKTVASLATKVYHNEVSDYTSNIRGQGDLSFDYSWNKLYNGGEAGGSSFLIVNSGGVASYAGKGRVVGNIAHSSLGACFSYGDTGGYVQWIGNTADGCAGYGINSNGANNIAQSNIILDWGGSNATDYGIYFSSGSGTGLIDGNIFNDTKSVTPQAIGATSASVKIGVNNTIVSANPLTATSNFIGAEGLISHVNGTGIYVTGGVSGIKSSASGSVGTIGGGGSYTLANGASFTFDGDLSMLFSISTFTDKAAVAVASYLTTTVTLLFNPDTFFENTVGTPGDGKIGISKGANSRTVTITNNTGSSQTISITMLGQIYNVAP